MIFKICAIALVVTTVSLILKNQRPDLAMLVTLSGGIIISLLLVGYLSDLFSWFDTLFQKTNIDKKVFAPVIKIVGIGYIAEFASSICEDSGSKSMSNKIEIAAKIIILVLSLPILSALIETIVSVI